jgi:hypothetical protein
MSGAITLGALTSPAANVPVFKKSLRFIIPRHPAAEPYEFQPALGEPVKEGVCREPEALSLLATDSSAALVSILFFSNSAAVHDRRQTTDHDWA